MTDYKNNKCENEPPPYYDGQYNNYNNYQPATVLSGEQKTSLLGYYNDSADTIKKMTDEEFDVMLRTVLPKIREPEKIKLFFWRCRELGIHPLSKQLIAWDDKQTGGLVFVTTIHYMQERSGDICDGVELPQFEHDDKGNIVSCVFTVYRKGCARPFSAVAYFNEYQRRGTNGKKTLWDTMPHRMIAKCAEAIARRLAFPDRFNQLYIREELNEKEFAQPNDIPCEVEDPAIIELRGEIRREAGKLMTNAELNKLSSETIGEPSVEKCIDEEKLKTLYEKILGMIPQPETK